MKRFGMLWLALAGGLAAASGPLAVSAATPPPAAAPAYEPPPLPALNATQTRGQAFAARRCSGCHNIGLDDTPSYGGPPFRQIADRYDSSTLAQRFAEVSAHGFDRMPPIGFTRDEARDLVAYFSTLHGAR